MKIPNIPDNVKKMTRGRYALIIGIVILIILAVTNTLIWAVLILALLMMLCMAGLCLKILWEWAGKW